MSWPLVKISDFCLTGSGGTPSREVPEYYQGDIPWIKSGDLRENIVTSATEFISSEAIQKSSAKIVSSGAILVAMYGATVGRMALLGIDAATNQAVCNIIPDASMADTKYVYYALLSKVPDFLRSAIGGAQPNISQGLIRSTEIPLPPLPEQKRIAAILDKADAIRRKRQQAIQLADDFLRAVFLNMFGDPVTNPKGWDEYVLNEIADIRSGVTKGKAVKPEESVTRPYMRVANVQDGYLDLADVQQITVSKKDAEKCLLLEGDILLTEGGDPDKLGRGHVWRGEVEGCLHQNHIFSVRVSDKERVRPAFLSAIISSPRGKRYFLRVGKQTTGIATINKSVLSEFVPFIPPIALQNKYLAIVNRIDAIKQSLAEGDVGLFNSLSHKAFAGQL